MVHEIEEERSENGNADYRTGFSSVQAFFISVTEMEKLRELRVLGGKKKSLNRRPGGHGNRLRTMPTL